MAVARVAGLADDGAQLSGDHFLGAPGASDPAAHGPVIALASAYAGASRLGSLLASHPDLACTAGTGLLPLCDHAMATWRNTDGPGARSPSGLAVTATRTLATTIITSVLARDGRRRWCEVAAASSQAAQTFLRLYPATRFICLYRACPGVIRAALDASPWGLADPAFAPFTRAYPSSTVAALTAYWVARTADLLDFERSHPQSCLRVRFEDLTAARHETKDRMRSFLGIASLDDQAGRPRDIDDARQEPEDSGPEPDFPVGLIPPEIRAQASDLHRQLDYPPLPAGSSSPGRGAADSAAR